MRFLIALFVTPMMLVQLSQANPRLCRNLLDPRQPFKGSIPGFKFTVTPKFSRAELEKNRHRLQPGRSEYMVGESGAFRLMIEERKVSGRDTPQLVVVKYLKNPIPADAPIEEKRNSDTYTVARKLHELNRMLKNEGLEDIYDVVLPIEVTENYIVLPYVEGQAFDSMTDQYFADRGIQKKDFKFHDILGPPLKGTSPILEFLWKVQISRMNLILKHLKSRGFVVDESESLISPDGIKFKASFNLTHPDYTFEHQTQYDTIQLPQAFRFRHDIIVTTDGRLVITDPY